MPVTQLSASVGRTTDSIANTLPAGFSFNGVNSSWFNTPGEYPFNGNSYVVTTSVGTCNNISINLWFRPLAANRILMTEQDTGVENFSYHYSMLEIDASGYVRGRIWDGSGNIFLTSPLPVNLARWNHIYLNYDNTNTIMVLNGGTPQQTFITRQVPPQTFIGIGTFTVTNIGTQNRYVGKINDLRISSNGEGSSWASTVGNYPGAI